MMPRCALLQEQYMRGKPPRKRPVLNFTKPQKFVTVISGQGKSAESFVIHKELITYHSGFFRRAFSSDTVSGNAGSMEMKDITNEAFGLVAHWLYFQAFPDTGGAKLPLETLTKVWTAAERFEMPAVQNHVSGLLCELLVTRASMNREDNQVYEERYQDYLASIKHIYFSTPAGEHKLKSLFLDIFHYHQVSYADRIDEFPIAFCQDVVRRLTTAIPASRRTWPVSNKSRFLVEQDVEEGI